jgi:hypothetical protein
MGLSTLKHLEMLEQSQNMFANVVLNPMNN